MREGRSTAREGMGTEKNFAVSLLEKERSLLAALAGADRESGKRCLDDISRQLEEIEPENTSFLKNRAIGLITILSREILKNTNCVDADRFMDMNDRSITQIEGANDSSVLRRRLDHIIPDMTSSFFFFLGKQHSTVLRKAERYMERNFCRKISLAEISAHCGISPSYFSSVFKREMGLSFSAYLNRLRVRKAANLLCETNQSMEEIAENCGFSDSCWFSKTFKRVTGKSPYNYRNPGGA
jgi:YesN/AraC family two-component response regulator